ncbi:FAD-dependent oxidoreductase [Bdellovibrio bacteriovorus]
MDLLSWGMFPKVFKQVLINLPYRFSKLPEATQTLLPRGLGRSYGDSCLNDSGILIGSQQLNHFIDFSRSSGVLRCESGVSFDEILKLVVPEGWFLPVTPGTKFVTVGGAIANDVHGKNHHKAGNFGHHVIQFELLKSTGERIICSREQNSDLFYATIGGLGLTGFITWAEFRLTKIPSTWIAQEQIQFQSLDEFFKINEASEKNYEYTVAWVDCVSSSKDIRGIYLRGNFASVKDFRLHKSSGFKTIPFFFPSWVLNKFSIKAFNALYYRKNLTKVKTDIVHYDPFFYPLDSIHQWNKIYGKNGFLQYQFVIPYKGTNWQAVSKIFDIIKSSEMGSFLAVLKTFGPIESEGMLSFPQEGLTLALDFPNYGDKLFKVLDECDEIVKNAGGRVYPAKDARMSASSFAVFYPRITEYKKYVDPSFSSSLWRRVK